MRCSQYWCILSEDCITYARPVPVGDSWRLTTHADLNSVSRVMPLVTSESAQYHFDGQITVDGNNLGVCGQLSCLAANEKWADALSRGEMPQRKRLLKHRVASPVAVRTRIYGTLATIHAV